MIKYEKRGASFLPDEDLLLSFDELANKKGGQTAAIKFLMEYYDRVSPLVGETWETVTNHGRLEEKLSNLEDHILAIKEALPGLRTLIIENEDGEEVNLQVDSFFG